MPGLLAGKFRGSGQTCVSPNRIYVQTGIYDEFIADSKKHVSEKMVAGKVDNVSITLDYVINLKALEKIEHLVADAKPKGANIVMGGERSQTSLSSIFFPATVLHEAWWKPARLKCLALSLQSTGLIPRRTLLPKPIAPK